jgi:hypothetical protein
MYYYYLFCFKLDINYCFLLSLVSPTNICPNLIMRLLILIVLFAISSCTNPSENTNPTENAEIVTESISTNDTSSTTNNSVEIPEQPTTNPNDNLTFRVFRNDTVKTQESIGGFGYDVMMNGRLYLHQPMIPAVQGLKTFNSEKDAKKMAEFVLTKIKNNVMPPTVSISEIDSLGIKY